MFKMNYLIVFSFILALAPTTNYAQNLVINQTTTTAPTTYSLTETATLHKTTSGSILPVAPVDSTSASSSSPVTPSVTTTTTTTTSEPDLEPTTVTSPPDSLNVNSDESTDSATGSILTIQDDPEREGIQGKSIRGNDDAADEASSSSTGAGGGGNNLAEKPNAKLSATPPPMATNGDTESTEPATTTSSMDLGMESTTTEQPPSTDLQENQRNKFTPTENNINMTQVDKIYVEGRKDEQSTVDAWHKINKKLKKGLGSIIGNLVPFALNMSTEAQISSNCSGAMLKWILSMNQLKSWALKMLDASGKPVAGLLEGSMTLFGNYRQCLKVRAPDDDEIEFAEEFRELFRGKYCIIQAKPWLPEKSRYYNLNAKLKTLVDNEEDTAWYDKTVTDELSEWLMAFNFVNLRMDLCVPSMCTREDIQKAVSFILKGVDVKARVVRCEMEAPTSNRSFALSAAASVESGSQDIADALVGASIDPAADGSSTSISPAFSQLGWIFVPLTAIGLVLLATVVSITIGSGFSTLSKGNINEEDDFKSDDKVVLTTQRNKFKRTIHSFSLHRSMSSHLNVDYDQLADDKPLALYGIRLLIVLWIILVESAVNLKFEYLRELLMLKDLIFWWPMQFIINSTLQFDSLILLSAFTMSYKNCLNDGANSIRCITKFVIDKYIRLMPSIMVTVAFVILLPLLYRGPVWMDYTTRQSAVCQSTGWLNTVFLQNYLPYHEICLPQTWLLCVEFQLVLLLAPAVYYLNKHYLNHTQGPIKTNTRNGAIKPFYWLRTIPGGILVACILFGLACSFYNVYSNELPPTWFYTMADPDSKSLYFSQHLMRLFTHIAVFAMGILAGVECRRAKQNVMRNYRASTNLCLSVSQPALDGKNHKNYLASSTVSLPVGCSKSQDQFESALNGSMKIIPSSSQQNQLNLNNQLSSSSSISIDIQPSESSSYLENNNNTGSENSIWNGINKNNNGISSIFLELFGFLLAITTMTTIIFSTHDWSVNDLPKPLVAGLFDIGSRFMWSIALIWVLYMVSVPDRERKFSLLARALGHPGLVCLGKLSFLIYIIHPIVHTSVLAIQEQPIYSSWLMLFHILIGNLTITVILAFFVSIFVEMPCRNLFRRCGTSLLLTHQVANGSTTTTATATANAFR